MIKSVYIWVHDFVKCVTVHWEVNTWGRDLMEHKQFAKISLISLFCSLLTANWIITEILKDFMLTSSSAANLFQKI